MEFLNNTQPDNDICIQKSQYKANYIKKKVMYINDSDSFQLFTTRFHHFLSITVLYNQNISFLFRL